MKCSCPKCNAGIDLGIQEIPAEGFFNKCPECSAGYLLKKESFARRALSRGNNITCAECGNELGPAIYCQNCHALYPDYYATEASSAAKKQLGKIIAILGSINRLGKTRKITYHHEKYTPAATKLNVKGTKHTGKPLQLTVISLILLVLLCSGGYFYYKNKLETSYCNKFISAVYIVKSAADLNINISKKISSDWKATQAPLAPKLSPADQSSIKGAMSDVELIMKELPKTPKKYEANRASLDKLYGSYMKLQTLTLSPTGTADTFAETTRKLDGEFRANGSALKSGLPEKLADAFEHGKKKYKPLNDM